MAIAPRDDRRHVRYEAEGDVELRVVYTHADDLRAVKARLRDLGMGGLMAATSEEIPPGVLADLDIRLEGKDLQNTLGLVRWSAPGRGVGIEFFYATAEEKAALERYIGDWLAARERRARPR